MGEQRNRNLFRAEVTFGWPWIIRHLLRPPELFGWGWNTYIQRMMGEWRLARCTSLSTQLCDAEKRQGGGDEALGRYECDLEDRRQCSKYMAQERTSPGVTAKPTQKDVVKMKRIMRYLSQEEGGASSMK